MATVLSVRNATKVFGGTTALDSVDMDVTPGEVRALVGQNGCGKSTLIKVLAGFHEPEPGTEVTVDGKTLTFGDPVLSEQLGLRFVHQDLGLVPSLDAVDNIAMSAGYATGIGGTIRWRKARAAAREALRGLGYEIDVSKWVSDLTMSERTAVAIARAMATTGSATKVLFLDEPTANLPGSEAERLYKLVHRVAESGIAVVFVSHHFDEVFEMADTVTVLRDGKLVETRPVEGLTEETLIALVIGRELQAFSKHAVSRPQGEPMLVAEEISGAVVSRVSFTVHQGEVVGVAGITGSGREEIAPMVFGGVGRRGTLTVGGDVLEESRPDLAIAAGVAMVPAERRANASIVTQTLRENITIIDPEKHFKGGFLRKRRERADVLEWMNRFDVRPLEAEMTMEQMSGGNQQKVIVARWMRQEPTVLILDEPTQGVDVGSKSDIHRLVDEAAAQNTAVLIASTDHEELVRVCDRVLILRRGRIVDELSGDRLTNDNITAATIGRDTGEPAA